MHVLIIPSEHFVTPRMPLGGIFQWHQALWLRRLGLTVGVVSPGVISPRYLFRPYRYPRREVLSGIPVYREYQRRYGLQRYADPRSAIATRLRLGLGLYREYVETHGRPDVVHAHDAVLSASVAHAIRGVDGVPYVLTEHSSSLATGSLSKVAREAARSYLAGAGVVTAVSTALGGWLRRAVGRPDLRVEVLANVLDPLFEVREARVEGGEHGPRFLSVGSLDANKDHATLIDAFAGRFLGRPASLRIVGAGPLRRHLERMVSRRGLGGQVEVLGALGRNEVKREMLSADCLVLSSRVETFGVVLIEALACGTPVVATRCGGPEDIVRAENGLLVPPGDPEGLGEAMVAIADGVGRYDPEELRRGCLQRYGGQRFAETAVGFYRRALGESRED